MIRLEVDMIRLEVDMMRLEVDMIILEVDMIRLEVDEIGRLADLLSPGLSLYCLLLRPLLVWPTSASADAAQDAPQMLYCDAKQQNLETNCSRN